MNSFVPVSRRRGWHRLLLNGCLLLTLFASMSPLALAESATWQLNPTDGDWNNAANWSPGAVPDGPADVATFETSNAIDVSLSNDVAVSEIVFNSGASSFTITARALRALTLSGAGIVNDSGIAQAFVADQTSEVTSDLEAIEFVNGATAGSDTVFQINGAVDGGSSSGRMDFFDNSSADQATIVLDGGKASGAAGGSVSLSDTSTAGNATLIANAGINGGAGGSIDFYDSSAGGTARVEVFGNATLDISGAGGGSGVTIGSLEGDGGVLLGPNRLTIGAANLNTTFSGLIQGTGAIIKAGKSTLTLSKPNSFTGGMILNQGTLVVSNTSGSATGLGPVQLNGGTLSGTGTIAGRATLGTGSGRGAAVVTGLGKSPGTINIQKQITFRADSQLVFLINSREGKFGELVAVGATIDPGAVFTLTDLQNRHIRGGFFTVIFNRSSQPIDGTFTNLPDGSIITVGSNTYQANYEGGDGNDLTLTRMSN